MAAGLPVALRTPAEQWAYAVKFKRAPGVGATDVATVVRIVLEVTVGTVGVGCLSVDRSMLLDETLAGVTAGPVTVELLVANPKAAGNLVVRNASAAGASEARILDIQCYGANLDLDGDRGPTLSDPHPVPDWSRYYGIGGRTLMEKLRFQRFQALTDPVVLRWTDGLSARLLPNDPLSKAMFVSNTYEPNTLVVLRGLLRAGDVFVDVGANAGIMSLAASRWVGATGRVYSLEPSEREYLRLLDNLGLNEITNVRPVRAAVCDHTGHATLRVASSSHGGLNTLGDRFAYEGVETVGLETVEATTLDDFIERQRIARVSVVKLDVEGAEGAVLAGSPRLLREHRPALVIEVFAQALEANGWSVPQLEHLLSGAAYRLFSIRDDTASLEPITGLTGAGERNIVALPAEWQRPS